MAISGSRFGFSDSAETYGATNFFDAGSELLNGGNAPGESGGGLYGSPGGGGSSTPLASLVGQYGSPGSSALSSMLGGGSGIAGLLGAADPSGLLDRIFAPNYDLKNAFRSISSKCLEGLFEDCQSKNKYGRNGKYRKVKEDCDLESFLSVLKSMSGGSYKGEIFDPCSLITALQGIVKKALGAGLNGIFDIIADALGSVEVAIAVAMLLADEGAEEGDWRTTTEIAGNGYASSVAAAKPDLTGKIAKGFKKPDDYDGVSTDGVMTELDAVMTTYDKDWVKDGDKASTKKVKDASDDFVKTMGSMTADDIDPDDLDGTTSDHSDKSAVYAALKAEKGFSVDKLVRVGEPYERGGRSDSKYYAAW